MALHWALSIYGESIPDLLPQIPNLVDNEIHEDLQGCNYFPEGYA